ncbi:MAG: ribosome-recycling factor [Candidatus Dojkabacteria bacterium]|nr:ribosome-recycling factor [Candidatus Dojkabacteria bacterium]
MFNIEDIRSKMSEIVKSFVDDLRSIRVNRLSIDMFERIQVDTTIEYGAKMNLQSLARIVLLGSNKAEIEVWDSNIVNKVKVAIESLSIGFIVSQSSDRKNVLIVSLPPMTQEVREKVLKQLSKMLEEKKISLRNVRQQYNNMLDKMEKVSEDEIRRLKDLVLKELKRHEEQLDELAEKKREQIIQI